MNIELKDLTETRKSLLVTLDKSEVDTEHQAVVGEIAKFARLPGFRPGRAPAALVVKRFAKEVLDELKTKVVGKAYRGGLDQTKLDVVNVVKVEEGTIEAGLSAAITFTLDVQPPFELPEYLGLPIQAQPTEPTDAEIDGVIERLRQERADFKVAARPAQKGDYVKLAYEGTVDGKPIAELVPEKQIYGKVPQTWEEVEGEQDGLIPGLGRQLAGLQAGDKKEVLVTFPAGFAAAPELGGKAAVYAIDVQEVRERVLPSLDEEFLKSQQAASVDALRLQVGRDLKQRKVFDDRRAQRQQIRETLASRIEFPLPESLISAETQEVLRRFMEENIRRGVPEGEFEKNKQELYENARRAAVSRVKQHILIAKIAEKEKIEVGERDLDTAIMREAMQTNQRPDKVAKELSKDRQRLQSLREAIVLDKALDFLVSKATITTAVPKL